MKRIISNRWVVALLGMAALAALAIPVYAGCGKCLGSAKQFAGELTKTKMTLAAAATLAEVSTKGTAVRAVVHKHADGVTIEVHCLAEGKIVAVTVDGATGKVGKSKPVSNLTEHVH